MKKTFLLFLSLFCINCFSYSIVLINDSPFELIAIIQGANGEFLGQELLEIGDQKQWTTDIKRTDLKDIYNNKTSLTPFTVIWKCTYKGYYSICTEVSPGSTVSANDCPGSKICEKKPKEEKICPPCDKNQKSTKSSN